MKILYELATGKIEHAIKDQDWYWFPARKKTTTADTLLDLPETSANQTLAQDILLTHLRVDINGDNKYYVRGGVIRERPGWVEHVPENDTDFGITRSRLDTAGGATPIR